ncbi:hypothetical protein X798_07420, partial [Onchocerca flexuosa]
MRLKCIVLHLFLVLTAMIADIDALKKNNNSISTVEKQVTFRTHRFKRFGGFSFGGFGSILDPCCCVPLKPPCSGGGTSLKEMFRKSLLHKNSKITKEQFRKCRCCYCRCQYHG